MGTLTGSDIQAQASELAGDDEAVTWTPDQILGWINEAIRIVCAWRPDASVLHSAVKLVAGTKQSVTGRRPIRVVRNMGSDGVTPGDAVHFVDMETKDRLEPSWHSDTAGAPVVEWAWDPDDPTCYYVYPPVPASTNVYVDLVQAVDPTAIVNLTDALPLDDVYSPAVLEWVMYRLFGRDSVETSNNARAQQHLQACAQLLGVKMKGDASILPVHETQAT